MSYSLFFFIFVLIVFVPHFQLTTATIFFYRLVITEPFLVMKDLSEIENYKFCPQLLLFLNQISARRELQNIVPSNAEPIACPKSKDD